MKKLFVVFMVVAMVAVTGCGNSKTLTCKMEEDGTVETNKLTFKKDKLTKLTTISETDISKEGLKESDLEEARGYYALVCGFFTGDGLECKSDVTTKKATITMTVDLEKAKAETLESLEIGDYETMEKAKKAFTDEGYTCK
jgi:Uncharacterized protein conserved in bacteria